MSCFRPFILLTIFYEVLFFNILLYRDNQSRTSNRTPIIDRRIWRSSGLFAKLIRRQPSTMIAVWEMSFISTYFTDWRVKLSINIPTIARSSLVYYTRQRITRRVKQDLLSINKMRRKYRDYATPIPDPLSVSKLIRR